MVIACVASAQEEMFCLINFICVHDQAELTHSVCLKGYLDVARVVGYEFKNNWSSRLSKRVKTINNENETKYV